MRVHNKADHPYGCHNRVASVKTNIAFSLLVEVGHRGISNDWLLRGFVVVVSYIRGDNLTTATS